MTTYVSAAGWVAAKRRGLVIPRGLALAVYALLALIVLVTVFGPMLISPDANTSHILDVLKPPSAKHWLGTDQQGRDVLARVVLGARASVTSSLAIVAGFSALG